VLEKFPGKWPPAVWIQRDAEEFADLAHRASGDYRLLATTEELLPTTSFGEQEALLNVAALVRVRAKLQRRLPTRTVSHEPAETVI
jgi:hypothetical protein